MSSWEPAGAYATTYTTRQSEPPGCPVGDIQFTFHTNQKVGQSSGMIKEESIVPISISMAVGYIQPKSVTNLQIQSKFMPSEWPGQGQISDVIASVIKSELKYMREFRFY